MKDQDFEKVMAYVDDELDAEQMAEVEAMLAEDAEARSFLAQLRESDQFVADGLNRVIEEPIPQRLINAAREQSSDIDKPVADHRSSAGTPKDSKVVEFPRRRLSRRWAWATAASVSFLVAGSAFMLLPGNSQSGALASALNTGLEQTASGEIYRQTEAGIQIMPVATFKTAKAGLCRQFAAQIQERQTVGLACRAGEGQWEVRAQQTLPGAESEETYSPASGGSGTVAEELQELNGGRPLSEKEERALISDHWQ